MRRRGRGKGGLLSRRKLLLALGAGLSGAGVTSTGAYSSVEAPRETTLGVASDPNALVGLTVYSPVRKNARQSLVDVENDTGTDLTVTITLDDGADGTLFDPQGNSGDTVSFSLGTDATKTVEIEARVDSGTVPFTITANGTGFSVEAPRETTAAPPALRINNLQGFSARSGPDDWQIDEVQVNDKDNDDDLDRVEYEIADSGGTVRATRTDTVTNGAQYQVQGISLTPDNGGYNIPNGEEYTLTVTAYDADGNSVLETRTTTASGGGNKNIRINKIQNFSANPGGQNDWSIKQVQIQDKAGAKNLDTVDYEIVDSAGNVVATRTDTGSFGQKYQEQNVTIEPDDQSYNVQGNETYTLNLTASDADGNTNSASRQT